MEKGKESSFELLFFLIAFIFGIFTFFFDKNWPWDPVFILTSKGGWVFVITPEVEFSMRLLSFAVYLIGVFAIFLLFEHLSNTSKSSS